MSTKKPSPLGAKVRRGLAWYNAKRHLAGYLYDRDPKHIAAAWRDYRRIEPEPDTVMLQWVDLLAGQVLNPPKAKVRSPRNTVRDLELYRLATSLRRTHPDTNVDDMYAGLARNKRMTPAAVKGAVTRVERALRDPYYRPRARR